MRPSVCAACAARSGSSSRSAIALASSIRAVGVVGVAVARRPQQAPGEEARRVQGPAQVEGLPELVGGTVEVAHPQRASEPAPRVSSTRSSVGGPGLVEDLVDEPGDVASLVDGVPVREQVVGEPGGVVGVAVVGERPPQRGQQVGVLDVESAHLVAGGRDRRV